MRMTNHPRLSVALCAAVLASHASARPAPFGEVNRDLSLDSAGSGSYTDSGTGDFDGDGLPDLVSMRGSTLETLASVSIFGNALADITGVSSFVVRNSDETRDSLIVSDSSGVHELVHGTAWTSTDLLTTATGSEDAVALALRESTSSVNELVLVEDDGVSVQLLSLTPSSSAGSPEFICPRTILRALAIDFDGDGHDELAFLHVDGVTVYESIVSGGSELWSINTTYTFDNSSYTGVDFAVGQHGSTEWLVWLAYQPNGVRQSLVYVEQGSSFTAVAIGQKDYVRLETGDWNGDGDDDLVLSRQIDQRVVVASYVSGYWHDFSSLVSFDLTSTPGSSSPNNYAQPVAFDLNNDGDLDIALAVQPSEELHMEMNTTVDGQVMRPVIDSVVLTTEGDEELGPFMNWVAHDVETDPTPDTLYVEITLDEPTTWPLYEGSNPVELTLEVHQYAVAASASTTHYINDPFVATGQQEGGGGVTIEVDTEEDEGFGSTYTSPNNDYYFLVAKYVKKSTGGEVIFSSPPLVIGYHAQGYADYNEFTEEWEGPGASGAEQLITWGGSSDPIGLYYPVGQDIGEFEGTVKNEGGIIPVGGRIGFGTTLVSLPLQN